MFYYVAKKRHRLEDFVCQGGITAIAKGRQTLSPLRLALFRHALQSFALTCRILGSRPKSWTLDVALSRLVHTGYVLHMPRVEKLVNSAPKACAPATSAGLHLEAHRSHGLALSSVDSMASQCVPPKHQPPRCFNPCMPAPRLNTWVLDSSRPLSGGILWRSWGGWSLCTQLSATALHHRPICTCCRGRRRTSCLFIRGARRTWSVLTRTLEDVRAPEEYLFYSLRRSVPLHVLMLRSSKHQ